MKLSSITLAVLALLLATANADVNCKVSNGKSPAPAGAGDRSDSNSAGSEGSSPYVDTSSSSSSSSSLPNSNSESTSQSGSFASNNGEDDASSSSDSSGSLSGSEFFDPTLSSSAGSDTSDTASDASGVESDDSSTSFSRNGYDASDSPESSSSDADTVGSDASSSDASGSSIPTNVYNDDSNSSSSADDDTNENDANYDTDNDTSSSTEDDTDDNAIYNDTDSSSSANNDTDENTTTTNDSDSVASWRFQAVKSVKVRVQGDKPVWNPLNQRFVSSYGSSFDAQYFGVTDTVNMAAVEGAFKYVQAECINASAVVNCQRKNKIKYVVFYETTVVQPRAAMAFYQHDKTDTAAIEYCPFIPMDGGQCTPTNGVLPKACDQYVGANGQPKLGMCVGGSLQDSDILAPYPNNYWFSYPNSCPTKVWNDKTGDCRLLQPGGLCPLGTEPDGVVCTFSYKVLGYVKLDDVVGITSMTNPTTGKTYADYAEFCHAGGVEYNVHLSGGELSVDETIPFWSDPADRTRNQERVKALVATYNAAVQTHPTTEDGGTMKPLPSVQALTKANPRCYENNQRCATAKFGCRRTLYSQICDVCTEAAADCVVKPAGFSFPSLTSLLP